MPLALKAAAAALQEFPELNARLEGDEIVYLDRYDLGVAVQTDQGLVVPVVRGCDTASLDELAAEVERLAEAARAGTLKPEELRGGTFTVTSAGKLGGLLVTPLVNHPEVGDPRHPPDRTAARRRATARSSVRQLGNVSVTFDHRVVDGARAAAFTLDVIRAPRVRPPPPSRLAAAVSPSSLSWARISPPRPRRRVDVRVGRARPRIAATISRELARR